MQQFPVRRVLAVVLAAAFVLLGGTIILDDGGQDPKPAAPTPAPTATPAAELPAGADPSRRTDLTSDLREETGIPAEDAARNRAHGQRRAQPGARRPAVPMPPCRTDFSGGVWSSRNGVRPTEFLLHYTVSSNRPGWSDVLAIENFFSTARTASSHYIIDFEANCLKMVRERDKAWTQGNANPWAISVEIIATGSETRAQWRASPLFQRRVLARLARNVMDRWDLPLRRVNPAGCVFPPGWTDHDALECGNDHHDVRPAFPYRLFARQLRTVG